MVHEVSWLDESLLRRPAQEDHRSPPAGDDQESGRSLLRGEPLLGQALRQTGRGGRSLAPKKRPGSKPKIDQRTRRLLEADLEERPAATLSERGEFLRRVAGLSVSESTLSRMVRRLGWSRKKIAESGRARRVPEGSLRAAWRLLVAGEVDAERLVFVDLVRAPTFRFRRCMPGLTGASEPSVALRGTEART
jgi:hypothetical protein